MFRWALKHTNVEVEVRLLKGGQTKKEVQPMKHHLHNIWEYQGIKLHSCINTWPVCSVFWQPEPIIIYLLIWLCVKTQPNTSRNHKHSKRTIIAFFLIIIINTRVVSTYKYIYIYIRFQDALVEKYDELRIKLLHEMKNCSKIFLSTSFVITRAAAPKKGQRTNHLPLTTPRRTCAWKKSHPAGAPWLPCAPQRRGQLRTPRPYGWSCFIYNIYIHYIYICGFIMIYR